MNIAVCGSSKPTDTGYDIAYKVGQKIANSGAVLFCGGLGGVMEGAAKGAQSAGGTTVGILPGLSRSDANSYITIPIVTGMSDARNVILVRSADLVVAIEGQYGTLSEIAVALKLEKPVIGFMTWSAITGVVTASSLDDLLSEIDRYVEFVN